MFFVFRGDRMGRVVTGRVFLRHAAAPPLPVPAHGVVSMWPVGWTGLPLSRAAANAAVRGLPWGSRAEFFVFSVRLFTRCPSPRTHRPLRRRRLETARRAARGEEEGRERGERKRRGEKMREKTPGSSLPAQRPTAFHPPTGLPLQVALHRLCQPHLPPQRGRTVSWLEKNEDGSAFF